MITYGRRSLAGKIGGHCAQAKREDELAEKTEDRNAYARHRINASNHRYQAEVARTQLSALGKRRKRRKKT